MNSKKYSNPNQKSKSDLPILQKKQNVVNVANKSNEVGKLYIVPTPIGNMEDITLRAIRILNEVDVILCEDTRVTSKLLQHLGINKKLVSYHNFNEKSRVGQIIEKLNQGESFALVSDAGTPSISDPGFILVKELIESNFEIISLPGAVASITALVGSGMDTESFIFLGFPPQKKGRQTFIKSLSNYNYTIIMYESPHRINKLIDELVEFGYKDCKICISRELTKIYEEYIRGTAIEIQDLLKAREPLKGEITVIMSLG